LLLRVLGVSVRACSCSTPAWLLPAPGVMRRGAQDACCTTRLAAVAVYIDDLGFGSDSLGYLVGGAGRGQARTHVQELADRALLGQVADYPGQERAVCLCPGHHCGAAGGYLGSGRRSAEK
jgi:hypothetical protein